MTNAEFDRAIDDLESRLDALLSPETLAEIRAEEAKRRFNQALADFEAASDETTRLVHEIAAGCTRPATPDESQPVELPKITPPRLPTGVDGEGVPPVYGVRR